MVFRLVLVDSPVAHRATATVTIDPELQLRKLLTAPGRIGANVSRAGPTGHTASPRSSAGAAVVAAPRVGSTPTGSTTNRRVDDDRGRERARPARRRDPWQRPPRGNAEPGSPAPGAADPCADRAISFRAQPRSAMIAARAANRGIRPSRNAPPPVAPFALYESPVQVTRSFVRAPGSTSALCRGGCAPRRYCRRSSWRQ
jgi:hypothetical protein